MNLVALPAFSDNYIWMLHDGREALVVDPGDAAPVISALQAEQLELTGILVTHHHADHVGGLAALLPHLRGRVRGPAREKMPVACEPCHDGHEAHWNGCTFTAMDVPGHTAGHIAWYLPASSGASPIVFCGDTLFSGGCGRLFEGTPAQMHQSLRRLASLPDDTRVCCAHEYTVANLRFGLAVEPDNAATQHHLQQCLAWRAAGRMTLPSSIGLEQQINPFLRCDQPGVMAAARARGAAPNDPVAVLGALRLWKNTYS